MNAKDEILLGLNSWEEVVTGFKDFYVPWLDKC